MHVIDGVVEPGADRGEQLLEARRTREWARCSLPWLAGTEAPHEQLQGAVA